MRGYWPLAVISATICLAWFEGTLGAQEPATVTGVVFHDLDSDGVRDADEPGLPSHIVEYTDATHSNGVSSREDGSYEIVLSPGTYTVAVQLDSTFGGCVDAAGFSFYPFAASFCTRRLRIAGTRRPRHR